MSAARYVNFGYRWRPLFGEGAAPRMLKILKEWEGTPYGSGLQRKSVGADCIRFGCTVLDELAGIVREVTAPVPDDTQFHDKRTSFRAVHTLRRMYPGSRRVRSMFLEPGDMIVTGPKLGGPGHAALVGPEKNTLWQCNRGIGVRKCGWGFEAEAQTVMAIYRLSDYMRAQWRELVPC